MFPQPAYSTTAYFIDPETIMNSSHRTSEGAARPSRPRTVTLLALGVLTLAVIHLLRFLQAIDQWAFLQEVLPFSPLYLALTGLFPFLAGMVLFWGLWRGLYWAPRWVSWASLVYTLYYWLDRLLLTRNPGRHVNWPFALAVTLIALAFVFWVLSRQKARAFFCADFYA